ncbi:MAG: STELLO glycosyltransferase family protein [Thermosynechococcaceae cyanobacterium MS004]|nr:STELLO glycosyltransferase family protein [Thermosynechococcaceae cyanobacterium MS004]
MIQVATPHLTDLSDRKTKKFIVITTINEPTLAVEGFAKIDNYQLVVVADKKTPANWNYEDVLFLSVEEQEKHSSSLSKRLPYNHYARKNLGYLYAINHGAETIVDTDDDNIPKKNWSMPLYQASYLKSSEALGFVNVYKSFTKIHIWPRGFPLDLVKSDSHLLKESELTKTLVNVGIWQGLADGDPDVDAIYRLVDNTPCFFADRDPVVLAKGTICPFNSQNTAFQKALFPLLYLPCFVTFRYTDILRGLVAQPIMWLLDYHLGFTKATVTQERNPHDYLKDFESEIPCYLYPYKVIDVVSSSIRSTYSVADNLYQAYAALCGAGIVTNEEVELVTLWLQGITAYQCVN